MKKRTGLIIAAGALGALALLGRQQRPGPLPPALDAERRGLHLPGFGQLAYYADPSGSGRPLLLLPSVNAAASAYEVRPLFDAYRGQRPVYALEWPGFGGSDRPGVRYDPALMVRALEAVLDLIGPDLSGPDGVGTDRVGAGADRGVDVVALSEAGEFAARAALTDGRLRTLALISPTGFSRRPTATSEQSERLYRRLQSPILAVPFYWLLTRRSVVKSFLKRSFVGAPDSGLVDYAVQATRQPGAVHAPLAFIAGQLRTPDALHQLYARLEIPTLLIYDRDGYVSFERVPQLTGTRRNVTSKRIVPSLGLPQFEQLPALKRALDSFWAAS